MMLALKDREKRTPTFIRKTIATGSLKIMRASKRTKSHRAERAACAVILRARASLAHDKSREQAEFDVCTAVTCS